MYRSISSSLALALTLSLFASATVSAGPPPSGTVSCGGVAGDITFGPNGIPFLGNPNSSQTLKTTIRNAAGNGCDVSGVTGGAFPITGALVSLRGRAAEGETCADFFATLDFEKTKLAVRWRGENAYGRPQTIGSSKATVASAVYDSGSQQLVIVTGPIARGAFAGSTMTFRFGIDGAAQFEEYCNTSNLAYVNLSFGNDGLTTIEVP